jgi:hypothetical protein
MGCLLVPVRSSGFLELHSSPLPSSLFPRSLFIILTLRFSVRTELCLIRRVECVLLNCYYCDTCHSPPLAATCRHLPPPAANCCRSVCMPPSAVLRSRGHPQRVIPCVLTSPQLQHRCHCARVYIMPYNLYISFIRLSLVL